MSIFLSHFFLFNGKIYYKEGQSLLNMCFYLIFISLFPFSLGKNLFLLNQFCLPIIWIGVILVSILSLENLFEKDFEEGVIDLFLLSNYPVDLYVFLKTIIHWFIAGLPIILISPLILIFFNSSTNLLFFFLTLLLGSITICFLGSIGAALTLSVKQKGIILSFILLPYCLPILIFNSYLMSIEQLYISIFFCLFAFFISPIICTFILIHYFE